ncbi:unnamed protein product, partial [Porites lobata]
MFWSNEHDVFLCREVVNLNPFTAEASGIAPDEPSELENLLDTIIALEERSEAESQELRAERNEKCENDRAKAEDA